MDISINLRSAENEDHHCIWLNNCIGRRNYRSFFVCIATSTLLCIYVIAFSVTHVVLSSEDGTLSFGTAFDRAPVSFCLAIVCFVLLIMVGGLTTYHCSLIIRGVSTHEQLRAHIMRARDYPTNPYMSKNPFVNILHILCRPQPKRYRKTSLLYYTIVALFANWYQVIYDAENGQMSERKQKAESTVIIIIRVQINTSRYPISHICFTWGFSKTCLGPRD